VAISEQVLHSPWRQSNETGSRYTVGIGARPQSRLSTSSAKRFGKFLQVCIIDSIKRTNVMGVRGYVAVLANVAISETKRLDRANALSDDVAHPRA